MPEGRKEQRWHALTQATGEGPARIVVLAGPQIGRRYVVDGEITIGRSVDASILVDDGKVSRRHARIWATDNGQLQLEDLGSRNGTSLNGVPVGGRQQLRYGDTIEIGDVVLLVTRYNPVEEQILQRQRLETLGRLSAGIAHDFNNMQQVVLSGLDYVQGLAKVDDEDILDCLEDVRAASRRSAELATRLLAFTRSDRHGFTRVDVAMLCKEAAQLARRTFPRTIEVSVEATSQLWVLGSSAELLQMLLNLCLNARDAMLDGGHLELRAEMKDGVPSDATTVVITVRDDGQGMDEATQERVFEPFFTTKGSGGYGLGLSTVRQIVTDHGGQLDLASTPGEGTTFTVELPIDSEPRRRVETLEHGSGPGQGAAYVMVVDDDGFVLRAQKRLLERAGHKVVTVGDGREAVRCFSEQIRSLQGTPDIVLLDLDLPGPTGEETFHRLKRLKPGIRIIMMSGHYDEPVDPAMGSKAGVVWLRKPFGMDVLLAEIGRALRQSIEDRGDPTGEWTIP